MYTFRTKDHGYFDNFTLVQYREEHWNLGYLVDRDGKNQSFQNGLQSLV